MQYAGVLCFATVGINGSPQVRCISAIHYEDDSLYFFTARGKSFCRELLENGQVQILAYTRYKEMIRVSAKAMPVPQTDQNKYIDVIFDEQPYLKNVYPGKTREIGIVFSVKNMEIEYFNLGVKPIFRKHFFLGEAVITQKGYKISNACVGCAGCLSLCPQNCIKSGKPYQIIQENCLHCGNCFEHCPAKAIIKVN